MKYEKNSKGYLYYAHNNRKTNYIRLAICSAITGRYQMNNFRATIVTDKYSMQFLDKKNEKLLEKCFEHIILKDEIEKRSNSIVNMNNGNPEKNEWYNTTRVDAFLDSKYEQTILIDVDYIFQDNKTELLWNSKTPVKINKDIIPLTNKKTSPVMIGTFTIPMYWATLVYFNRDSFSKQFFDLVNHIQENYEFYCVLYQAYDWTYRNDYAFAIALYMLNGFRVPGPEYELPFKYVLSEPNNDIHQISLNSTRFLVQTGDWKAPWHYVNLKDISYHCMNKKSLLELYDTFIEFYDRD